MKDNAVGGYHTLFPLGSIKIRFLTPMEKIIKNRCNNKTSCLWIKKNKLVFSVTHSFLFEIGAKLSAPISNRKGVGSVVNRKMDMGKYK